MGYPSPRRKTAQRAVLHSMRECLSIDHYFGNSQEH
jgi:hypothetical protein